MKFKQQILAGILIYPVFNAGALAAEPELIMSQTGQREHSEPLEGQLVSADRTLTVSFDNLPVTTNQPDITFYLNGVEVNEENGPPYDMFGTDFDGSPNTFPSNSLPISTTNTITAEVDYPFFCLNCPDDFSVTATFERLPPLEQPAAGANYDFSAVDQMLDDAMVDEDLNGIGLIVVDKEEGPVFESYRGIHSPGRISLLASTSKMIAAGVLAKLEEQGLLDLEMPVTEFVDWNPASLMTPAQLLSNSSGLPGIVSSNFDPDASCQRTADDATTSLLSCGEEILAGVEPAGDPDQEYRYGGVQWQVAGALAEAVSGKTWAQLIAETYIEPCQLETLGFGNPFEIVVPSDFLNVIDPASAAIGIPYPSRFNGDPTTLTQINNPLIEGGGYSNARDYGQLLMMHLNDGACPNGQVLSTTSLSKLHADRVGPAYGGDSGDGNGYGMGWFVERDGPDAREDSFGSGIIYNPGAFGALAWLDLVDGYGAFLIMEDDEASSKNIRDAIVAAVEAIMADSDTGSENEGITMELIDNLFIDHNFTAVSLTQVFDTSPLIFSAMQTTNGSDTASIRIDADAANVSIKVEEETSKDDEKSHADERVGLLAFEAGLLLDSSGNVIGEVGRLPKQKQTNGSTWFTQTLENNYIDPVVFVQVNSINGGAPVHMRLQSVTSSEFTYQMEEWDYQDGQHSAEDLVYMVVEVGVHDLINGSTVQAFKVDADHQAISTAFLQPFNQQPVVLSLSQTRNGGQAIVTRMENVTESGVSLKVQEEENNDGTHAVETLGVIAISG